MNKKQLQSLALRSVDTLGFTLDDLGVTSRFNRHQIAATVMLWQWRWQGEKDRWSIRTQRWQRRVQPLWRKVQGMIGRK